MLDGSIMVHGCVCLLVCLSCGEYPFHGCVARHRTEPFAQPGAPTSPPMLSKDAVTELKFMCVLQRSVAIGFGVYVCDMFRCSACSGDGMWNVVSDGEPLATYRTQDLRISLVWRSRCFESQQKKDEFKAQLESHDNDLTVEEVLDTLVVDLRKR